jgi:predicted RNA-binding Zn-ribbon protein involved in translation (DUF1610 family)
MAYKPGFHTLVALAERTCATCGEVFTPNHPARKYCSPACGIEAQRLRTLKTGEMDMTVRTGKYLRAYRWPNPMRSPGWLMPHRNGDGISCPHCGGSHVLRDQLPECAEVERRRAIVDEIKARLRRREKVAP